MSEKKYRTAVGYVRVSSTGQEKLGTSLESQKRSIQDFCINNDIVLLHIYEETSSGKDFKRPQYEKAVQYLKQNKEDIDLFLTKNIDRFSRNVAGGIIEIEEIKQLGIEVNFIDEWVDSDTLEGKLLRNVKLSFAEYERLCIVTRTRLGEKTAMRNGRYIKTPPMGYSRGGIYNGKKTIIPNEKAPLIKQLFEEYATGLYSQKELIQRFKPKGLNLSKSNLSVLLDNILYAGFIDLKKHKIEPFTLIKGVHKPIISEELFYKVQKIKTGRNRMVKKVRPKNEKFPLSAFMLCSCCGKPMYGATSNNGKNKKIRRYYDYYGCKNRCKNQSFDAKLVHSEFQKELSAIKPSKGIVALFKQIVTQQIKEALDSQKTLANNLSKKISTIEQEQLTLTEKYIQGKIDDDIYEKLNSNKRREIGDMKVKIKELEFFYRENMETYLDFGLSILENLDKFYENAPIKIKMQLLGSYFSDKLIFEGKKFRTLPFMDSILLICRYNRLLQRNTKRKGIDFSTNSCLVVAAEGFEPSLTEPKSVVLSVKLCGRCGANLALLYQI